MVSAASYLESPAFESWLGDWVVSHGLPLSLQEYCFDSSLLYLSFLETEDK
jgi:hypothetical protein